MKNHTIIFVCEHGAAKSILAAAYYNKLATEKGLSIRAIARGTNPDAELSSKTMEGLQQDGLIPTESSPQKLTPADMEAAHQIVSFCELPDEFRNIVSIKQWNDVPPVSEDYEKARDVIVMHIHTLFKDMLK